MADLLENVLTDIGWDSGFTVPVANAENRTLETDVILMQQEAALLKAQVEIHEQSIKYMIEHEQELDRELQEVQYLIQARESESQAEGHLQHIISREFSRLLQMSKEIEREATSLQVKKEEHEELAFNCRKEIESIEGAMKWDKRAVEVWIEQMIRRDKDNVALLKYAKSDEENSKESVLQIDRIGTQLRKTRDKLQEANMQVKMEQVALDKTALDFRSSHEERKGIIECWESTISHIQERDKEIEVTQKEIDLEKELSAQKAKNVQENQRYLDLELRNNAERETHLKIFEKSIAHLIESLLVAKREMESMKGERDALQTVLQRTSSDLESVRGKLKKVRSDIKAKQVQKEHLAKKIQELEDELKTIRKESTSADDKLKKAEGLLEKEKSRKKYLETKLKKLKVTRLLRREEMNKLYDEERLLEMQMGKLKNELKAISCTQKEIQKQRFRQEEILYQQKVKVDILERKIKNVTGNGEQEELQILQASRQQLLLEVKQRNEAIKLLEEQTEKQKTEIVKVQQGIENKVAEEAKITSKADDMDFHDKVSNDEVKELEQQKQNLILDECLLKVRVKQVQRALKAKEKQVFNAERSKIELEAATEERKTEISTEQQVLQSELQSMKDEKHKLQQQLVSRKGRTKRLQKRYEVIMSTMGPNEGLQNVSESYFVVKTAQEREELQDRSDSLQSRLNKKEKETEALRNTLQLLKSNNSTFKNTCKNQLRAVEEKTQKETLKKEAGEAKEKLQHIRKTILKVESSIQRLAKELENFQSRQEDDKITTEELQDTLSLLKEELSSQEKKLERVNQMSARALKNLLKPENIPNKDIILKNLEIRKMRERNRRCVSVMENIILQNESIADVVQLYFAEVNIPNSLIPYPVRAWSNLLSVCSASKSSSQISGSKKDERVKSTPASPTSSQSSTSVVNLEFPGTSKKPKKKK